VVYYRYFCPLYSDISSSFINNIIILFNIITISRRYTLYSKYDKSRHVPKNFSLIKLQNSILHKRYRYMGVFVFFSFFLFSFFLFKYLDKVTVFTIQIARTFICIFFFFFVRRQHVFVNTRRQFALYHRYV